MKSRKSSLWEKIYLTCAFIVMAGCIYAYIVSSAELARLDKNMPKMTKAQQIKYQARLDQEFYKTQFV